MLDWAMNQTEHPVAIRVPGLQVVETGRQYPDDYSDLNKYVLERPGKDVAIIGAGTFLELGAKVADILVSMGINATLINPRYLSGLDEQLLNDLKDDHKLVITLEDGILDGGFGEKIARFYGTSPMRVKCYGLKKEFADRYNLQDLLKSCRLTPEQISEDIQRELEQ